MLRKVVVKTGVLMTLLLVVGLAPATLSAQRDRQDPVLVYVSAPLKDGFVDTNKDIQDSVKDLQGRLSKKKKVFRLVESRASADIVVTILMRDVGAHTYG